MAKAKKGTMTRYQETDVACGGGSRMMTQDKVLGTYKEKKQM